MNDSSPVRRVLLMGLLLATTFLCGVFLDRSNFLLGNADREPPGVGHTFAPFWEAWDLVHERYVDQNSVDNVHMTRSAISGMLDSLGDEGHTTYLAPDDVKRMESSLKGELEGIGARITVHNHVPTILQAMPKSPARDAGLKAGDVLVEVDGKPITHESLQQIVEQVRGKAGTEVKLRVLREGQTEPIDIPITRGKVEVPDVSWHMLPGAKGQPSLAHIAIESFGDQADDQLRAMLKEAREQGARGVVLDLRGNPGGLKDQAVAVTSEFLRDGDVFIDQDAKGRQTAVPVKEGGTARDVPLCVLIDGGTASAAEICSGALQDHKRAQLVGEKTFGTGTVLQPFPLSDGGAVLLATSEWLTPNKRQIWHEGIKPDVEVALPEGAAGLLPELEEGLDWDAFKEKKDAQLLKAMEILQKEVQDKSPRQG